MGLDISAYRQVTKMNPSELELDSDGYSINGDVTRMHDFQNENFPRQGEGLDLASYYDCGTEYFGFRAGSYSGYNQWRSELAQMAGVNESALGPSDTCAFAELIYFSDCEGFIGPVVSAKLANDFAAFAQKAEDFSSNHPYFLQTYNNFRYAFEMAKDGGMVHFH